MIPARQEEKDRISEPPHKRRAFSAAARFLLWNHLDGCLQRKKRRSRDRSTIRLVLMVIGNKSPRRDSETCHQPRPTWDSMGSRPLMGDMGW